MPATKTPTPSHTLTKLYEDDAVMLDRVRALATLKGWAGDWDSRADTLRHVLAAYIDGLPKANRDMLEAA